jgi:hypothetical protein
VCYATYADEDFFGKSSSVSQFDPLGTWYLWYLVARNTPIFPQTSKFYHSGFDIGFAYFFNSNFKYINFLKQNIM